MLQGTNTTPPDILLLNRGSGVSYGMFFPLPPATTGNGDTVQAIPGWRGTPRVAFLVNNGVAPTRPDPPQLIEMVGG